MRVVWLILFRLLSAVPLLIRRLKEHPNRSNIHIVYPDEGAFTRFHTIMEAHGKEWPIVKCTKVRRGEERIVTIKEGSVVYKIWHVSSECCSILQVRPVGTIL